MEEVFPGVSCNVASYIIGLDSLKTISIHDNNISCACEDIRLRMDGLFELKEHAVQFETEFTALYTNGPAGGGGVRSVSSEFVLLIFLRSEAAHLRKFFNEALVTNHYIFILMNEPIEGKLNLVIRGTCSQCQPFFPSAQANLIFK